MQSHRPAAKIRPHPFDHGQLEKTTRTCLAPAATPVILPRLYLQSVKNATTAARFRCRHRSGKAPARHPARQARRATQHAATVRFSCARRGCRAPPRSRAGRQIRRRGGLRPGEQALDFPMAARSTRCLRRAREQSVPRRPGQCSPVPPVAVCSSRHGLCCTRAVEIEGHDVHYGDRSFRMVRR